MIGSQTVMNAPYTPHRVIEINNLVTTYADVSGSVERYMYIFQVQLHGSHYWLLSLLLGLEEGPMILADLQL